MQNVKNIRICRNKRGKEECKYRAKSGWELNCSNSGWIDCCCCCSGESSAAQLLAGGQVTTLSQLKYKKVSKYFPSLNSGFFQVLSWETFESPEAWILNWTYAWVKTFDQGKIYNNISLLSKSVRKCEVGVKEQMHSWSCWLKRGPGCCLPMSEEGSVSSRGAEDWDFGKNLFWKSVTFQHCDYFHYHPIAVPVQQCFSIRGSLAVETPLHTRKSLLWLFLWNPPAVELQNVSFSGSEPEEWWGRSWKQKGFSALPERYGHYFRHHHHHHFHKYLYRCHHGHHQIICLLSSSLTLSWIYHEYHIAKHLLNHQKPARFRPLRLQTLKPCDPHNGYWTLH